MKLAKKYDHRKVEKKWQKIWEQKKLNRVNIGARKKKFYALVEFPYPSGEGLHVGHIRSYTAMDVIARKRRAEGYEVLYPMGWDAFGLPTENYAIKTGLPPQLITKRNVGRYRKQLQSLGFSFDWSREINTTDPNYYRFTQWMFLQFFKKGLAYKAKMPINWCPKDKIGLANEEVVDGKCERCGTLVEKREKEQWLLAITKYADRLDHELDLVDYPDSVKSQQRHWITNLHDWVFSRQRYWGEPIPLIFCEKDGWVPVPEKYLPVKLPRVLKYKPTDTGESPLANMDSWIKVKCPKCGARARRETDTMPNWAGSSWYYLAYIMKEATRLAVGQVSYKLKANKLAHWLPVDWYNGGMEHTTLHLLYSRFWHKVLNDLKLVPGQEPYQKRTSHGFILAADGEKMSKSRGNVVNPDEVVGRFGADTVRTYEMFMGPFNQAIIWNEDGLVGARRFLERVWRVREKVKHSNSNSDLEAKLHQAIEKVSEDIEAMKFNTAISTLMILLNYLEMTSVVPIKFFKTFLKLLSPFAPHITDELWFSLDEKRSIHLSPWPRADKRKIESGTVTIVVQVNGHLRNSLVLPIDSLETVVVTVAKESEKIKPWLDGKVIKKTIFIPNQLINFVVTP
ncbi:MAG TPA: class I tRNA ligase family protein [Candidatus Paceibacterota bacterium]